MRSALDKFVSACVECALWSSNDESDESGGEPLDKNYGPTDIHPDTLAKMRTDCEAFVSARSEDIDGSNLRPGIGGDYEMAGHDFWLTRCGHGTGFWDRGRWDDENGQATRLDETAKSFGEFTLYVGDDGMIHGCRG